MITFKNIWDLVCSDFITKLENHKGLEYLVKHRSKFEGWMKVELCDVLSKLSNDITPEKDRIDIVIENFGIELKTPNTNYRTNNVESKTRPITKNIESIIIDIDTLKNYSKCDHNTIMFIVFPLPLESEINFEQHITKISTKLKQIESREFNFINGVRGKIFFGLVE